MISNGGVYKRKDWVKWKQHNQLLKGNSARLGGKSIKGKANEAFYKELIEVLTPEVDRAGLGPQSLPAKFDGTQRISESGTMVAGDDIVAAGFFFNSMYERQLAYNICTKMFKEHPYPGAYGDEKVQRKMCKWHVYVLGKNRPEFILDFRK